MSQLLIDTILLLILYMFTVSTISSDIVMLFIAIIVIVFLLKRGGVRLPRYLIVGIMVLVSCYIAGYLLAAHSQNFGIVSSITLISLALIVENLNFHGIYYNSRFDIFYFLMTLFVIYSILTGTRSLDGSVVFVSLGDKNYSAMLVFLFFLYSNKKDKITGVLIAFIYGLFFVNSRSYVMLLCLYYLIMYFQKPLKRIFDKFRFNYFKFMVLLFVFVMIFSVFWVYVISATEIGSHYSSLNDASNRVRFVSNIRSFEFLLEDLKQSLIWGYGYDYVHVLGVDVTYSQLPIYMGTKILQAHNSYLNTLIQMGIIAGISYFYLLGKIFERFDWKENCQYIIPYLINACFMHSLLNGSWLVFFLIILILPQQHGTLHSIYNKIRIPHIIRRFC